MSDTVQLFVNAWKLMVGRLPSPTIKEDENIVSCFGNVPLVLLNVSMVIRPTKTHDALRAFLDMAARQAASCEYPSCVLVREDWLPAGWETLVDEAHLSPLVPLTGMDADELLPPRYPPANLDMRPVVNDTMARDLAKLNALAYHMPADAFDCIANMHLWHADSHAYVGYVDNQPVSCAAAFPVSGTIYIALVATLPEEQGKGYAEAVTRRALIHGRQTMRTSRTTLHASNLGVAVYRRMGYRLGPKMIILQRVESRSGFA